MLQCIVGNIGGKWEGAGGGKWEGIHITCSLSSLISWVVAAFVVVVFCMVVLVMLVFDTRDAPPPATKTNNSLISK